MQCLNCDNKTFTARESVFIMEACHDKVFHAVAWICDNCGEALMDDEQMNQLLNDYKKKDDNTP